MRFPDGRASIEGFYEQVVPPTPYEREVMGKMPFDATAFKENLGIAEFAGPKDGIRASALVLQRFAGMPRSDLRRGLRDNVA